MLWLWHDYVYDCSCGYDFMLMILFPAIKSMNKFVNGNIEAIVVRYLKKMGWTSEAIVD